jgi:hypothetical protein
MRAVRSWLRGLGSKPTESMMPDPGFSASYPRAAEDRLSDLLMR